MAFNFLIQLCEGRGGGQDRFTFPRKSVLNLWILLATFRYFREQTVKSSKDCFAISINPFSHAIYISQLSQFFMFNKDEHFFWHIQFMQRSAKKDVPICQKYYQKFLQNLTKFCILDKFSSWNMWIIYSQSKSMKMKTPCFSSIPYTLCFRIIGKKENETYITHRMNRKAYTYLTRL